MESTKGAVEGRRPPAPFVEAAEGRLHYMWAGEAANISKTHADEYQTFANLRILPISPFSPYVAPGAIYLAKCTAPYKSRISQT